MNGRTVKIYLVDGIPSGVMTAEIMNWTGKFTVAPRSQLADLARREELKRTGVYILVEKIQKTHPKKSCTLEKATTLDEINPT